MKKEAVTFLKKSNQKTFIRFYTGCGHVPGPQEQKSFFASFFSKKEVLPS